MKNRIANWFAFISVFCWGAALGVAACSWAFDNMTPGVIMALTGLSTFPLILFVAFVFITTE